jgi:hypothetical protein
MKTREATAEVPVIDFTCEPTQPAVAVAEPPAQLPANLAPEAATIFSIIERAARDQSVDIDKMERLISMQERMQAKAAELDFDNAMAEAQAAMKTVRKDANNPQTRSKYASFAALDKAIRPIYTKHGFSLSFSTADGAPADCVRIVCKVAHRGGHRERPHLDMPTDGKGAKGADVMTKTHAAGAAMTYGQRYLVKLIFNLAIAADHDGNDAGGKQQQAGTRASVSPEGADFWDCEGPGVTAYAAKQQGLDVIHEAMREGIAQQFSAKALNEWIDNNIENIRKMPRSWRVILRQAADEQAAGF